MALSAQDKNFYEEKLGSKTFCWLLAVTVGMGAIFGPLLFYVQDLSSGQGGRWTFGVVFDWSAIGMMLGSVVAVVMFLGFKFLLTMEWLPSRR